VELVVEVEEATEPEHDDEQHDHSGRDKGALGPPPAPGRAGSPVSFLGCGLAGDRCSAASGVATAQIDLCSDLRDRFGHRVREFTWHSYMVPLRPEANVKKDATVASGSWPTVFLGLIR
jgi:hypothetical protein